MGNANGLVAAVAVILACEIASTRVDAQITRSIDLAGPEKSDTAIVPAGDYQIQLVSKVPHFAYTIEASFISKVIPPFEVPPTFVHTAMTADSCASLKAIHDEFGNLDDERKVPGLIARAGKELKSKGAGCPTEAAAVRTDSTNTEYLDPPVYTLDNEHYLLITVARISRDGKSARIWQRLYSTGIAAGWRPMYGYVFPALIWTREVFTKAVPGTTNQFAITRAKRSKWFDAVPSVLFSFTSGKDADTEGSWTAGLGLDPGNPFIAGGYGWTYHSNLHLGFGIAMRREPILLGKYKEGDIIATDLTGSQLTLQEYRPEPYVSLTFRFAKNPFGGASTDASTKGKNAAKPQVNTADSSAKKPPL